MKVRKIVASLIVIYNLIGLIAVLGLAPSDPFYWDGSVLLLLFTFPITIISFGFRYSVAGYLLVVVIIQLIILSITLLIGDYVTKGIMKNIKKGDD